MPRATRFGTQGDARQAAPCLASIWWRRHRPRRRVESIHPNDARRRSPTFEYSRGLPASAQLLDGSPRVSPHLLAVCSWFQAVLTVRRGVQAIAASSPLSFRPRDFFPSLAVSLFRIPILSALHPPTPIIQSAHSPSASVHVCMAPSPSLPRLAAFLSKLPDSETFFFRLGTTNTRALADPPSSILRNASRRTPRRPVTVSPDPLSRSMSCIPKLPPPPLT